MRCRRAASPAQARSRKAARSAGSPFSSASVKIDSSCMTDHSRPRGFGCCLSMRRLAAKCARILEKEMTTSLLALFADFFSQPGAGVGPDLRGLARRDPQQGGGLDVAEAGEEAELHQFGGARVGVGQPIEGRV